MKIAILHSGQKIAPEISKACDDHLFAMLYDCEHDFTIYDEITECKKYHGAILSAIPPVPPENTYGQILGIEKVSQKVKGSYDWIVRCRRDVYLGNKIDWDSLDPSKIYMLPLGRKLIHRVSTSGGYTFREGEDTPFPKDFFWIASPDLMLEFMKELWPQCLYQHLKYGMQFCPEDLLFSAMADEELLDRVELLPNPKNGLFRPNGHHHGSGVVLYNELGPYQESQDNE